jgi:3'-5' exoribonuclease
MSIKELKKGDHVDSLEVMVEQRSEATTKSGKAYLNLTLRDETGSIPTKLWDFNPTLHGAVVAGKVFFVNGVVDEYNGALQLTIRGLDESNASPDKFAKKTKFNVEKMWNELVTLVSTFEEPLTKFVAEEMLIKQEQVSEAFKRAPAARGVHNAWYGGLLEHVSSICKIAEPTIAHYKSHYFEKLSRDKVLFGVIAHDAGKIVEYDYSKPTFDSTTIGLFTNHIVLGPAWVFETANRFPNKGPDFKLERAHLMHLIAAHHGQLEWGSPVQPVSLEAILVHQLDMIDSKFMHAFDMVTGKPGSIAHFSEKSYINRTPYYQP